MLAHRDVLEIEVTDEAVSIDIDDPDALRLLRDR